LTDKGVSSARDYSEGSASPPTGVDATGSDGQMSTLQNHAEALLEKIDQRERTGGKLAPEDRALILRLAAKGNLSQEEIAKAVGCSQPTVSRVVALLDTRKEARTILESGASKLAQTVVDTDDAGVVGTYTIGAFIHVLLVIAIVLFIVGMLSRRTVL